MISSSLGTLSLRCPGDIPLATGDLGVEFGEARARNINAEVTDDQVVT